MAQSQQDFIAGVTDSELENFCGYIGTIHFQLIAKMKQGKGGMGKTTIYGNKLDMHEGYNSLFLEDKKNDMVQ